MKDLITYIVKNITGSDDFEVEEKSEDTQVTFIIKVKPDYIGMVIGKEGKTIKAIRTLVKVRATLEKKSVNAIVEELT